MPNYVEDRSIKFWTEEDVVFGVTGYGVPFVWNPDTGRIVIYRIGYSIVLLEGEVSTEFGIAADHVGTLLFKEGDWGLFGEAVEWLDGGPEPVERAGERVN